VGGGVPAPGESLSQVHPSSFLWEIGGLRAGVVVVVVARQWTVGSMERPS
jgi:hypothetical protein